MTTLPAGPAALARSYLDSFATRDVGTISAHVSSDFVNEHTAALGTGCEGRLAYQSRLPDFLGDMIDLRYIIEDLVTEPDERTGDGRVAAFYTLQARWQGRVPISIRGVQRLVIRDDLITHRTDYWDSAVFLKQADDQAREVLARFGI